MTQAVWLITGTSSGLGQALARALLVKGNRVVLCARTTSSLDVLARQFPDLAMVVRLDVTNAEDINRVVRDVTEHFGTIDVLVNNAGVSYIAGIEEADEAGVAWQFETNVFGPAALIRAVLPMMRAQRRGIIVNISSSAAIAPQAGSGFYSASKLALEGLSDALRLEVAEHGIKVLVIEPGGFSTSITSNTRFGKRIPAYAATSGALRDWVEIADPADFPGDLDRGAAAIMYLVESGTPPPRAILGSDAFAMIMAKCEEVRSNWEQGEALARSTDRIAAAGFSA